VKFIRKTASSEGDANAPPAWIVSFTDMVTLLLAFFVLLQAFAHVQDPALFFVGRDAFKRAIAGLGIPGWLLGKDEKVRHDYLKVKHTMEEAEQKVPRNRVLDAQDEEIRQAFATIEDRMETSASDITEKLVERRMLALEFSGDSRSLAPGAVKELESIAVSLRQNMRYRGLTVYVISLSPDGKDTADRLLASSLRAGAVEDVLTRACGQAPAEFGWKFESWGAGGGGKWLESIGRMPEGTNTVVVITERE
jgi:hypothetical protein